MSGSFAAAFHLPRIDAWVSSKPSKRALQFAFYAGKLAVSERTGMLKTYELMNRHFQWDDPPKSTSETQTTEYLFDMTLRSQELVSLDSICHLNAKRKALVRRAIETRMRRGLLVPVAIDGEIVAIVDLKADRERRKLLQQWSGVGQGKASRHKRRIEEKLHQFEQFQFAP